MSNEIATVTRTMEEITASVRLNMQNMVNSALNLGMDLMDAKEACGHGRWLPWLKSVGISSSTANNYMRIAREVSADSAMARLPYSKVLALLSLPPEEREEVAEKADDMSAAEIRRLTEERNKAAEAANTESARADQAEEEAKRYYDEKAHLNTQLTQALSREEQLIKKTADLERAQEELQARVLIAENNRVEVEVVPEDYEIIKKKLANAEKSASDLINAAAEAEERAAAAESELEEMRMQENQNNSSQYEKLHFAMRTFMLQCEGMAFRPSELGKDQGKARTDVEWLREWCNRMLDGLDSCITAEKAVVV